MTTKIKVENLMPVDTGEHSVVVTSTAGATVLKPGESGEFGVADGVNVVVKEGPKTHTGPSTHS